MVFDSGQGISATVAPETSFLSSRLKKARYKNGDLWQAYHAFFLDRDSLDFIERNPVLSAVVELGCARRFMVSDLLSNFQLAAVL